VSVKIRYPRSPAPSVSEPNRAITVLPTEMLPFTRHGTMAARQPARMPPVPPELTNTVVVFYLAERGGQKPWAISPSSKPAFRPFSRVTPPGLYLWFPARLETFYSRQS
jgi:hypothetical protein